MWKYFLLISAMTVFIFCGCGEGSESATQNNIHPDSLVFTIDTIAKGLFAPLAIENAHDGSGRLFVGEQAGKIMVLKNGAVLPEPFIDIRRLLVPMRNEYMDVGLLGFAFHPDYKNNGRFFVHYSAPSKKGFDNTSILAEGKVSATNPDKAVDSLVTLLQVEQPESNHNGGNIVFDKDGFLFLGFGDGGGQGDQHGKIGNSQ